MSYFNRPWLLRRSLNSILESHEYYPNWKLGFCDDNSIYPGIPIVQKIMSNHINRVFYFNTQNTIDDKIGKGLSIGNVANIFIRNVPSDIVITLCDDDRLVTTYIRDLCLFFEKKPNAMYVWSKIHTINPFTDEWVYEDECPDHFNAWDGNINPSGKVDGSQVAFRTECFTKHNIWYEELSLQNETNLDCCIFIKLYEKFGPALHTGLFSQYKGIHPNQLIWHKKRLKDFYADEVHENFHSGHRE